MKFSDLFSVMGDVGAFVGRGDSAARERLISIGDKALSAVVAALSNYDRAFIGTCLDVLAGRLRETSFFDK